MHTSHQFAATDFEYWQLANETATRLTFADFCPDYHELDRVGMVSPYLEDEILYTGQTLLALTTAFYDCHRARGGDFFDYPQHFAFVGATADKLHTGSTGLVPDTPAAWAAWSWLDVWPANKWIATSPTATTLLQKVFDFQINRLYWPRHLTPQSDEERLPNYVYRMLGTRLKSVTYYPAAASPAQLPTDPEGPAKLPAIEVRSSPTAHALWQESVVKLPSANLAAASPTTGERLQPVAVDDFLQTMLARPKSEPEALAAAMV